LRVLGKGKTAQAIQEVYPDTILFDDTDKDIYDINSDDTTVVSPGIPPNNFLVKNTKNKISDYDLFLADDMFTIWISGTNGKTTTTSMLYHILKDNNFVCGGNIGIPLAKIKQNKKLILETSSFTLHYTAKVKPNIYILLPISPDHIYWHGSFKEYENSKLKPLTMMTKDDVAIIPSRYKDIKTDATKYIYTNTISLAKDFDIDINNINFKEPFLQDAILALVATKLYSNTIDYEKINSFIQDHHKLEEFKDDFENIWVDDSKATNIDATIQAIKSYKNKKIYLILGGDDKGVSLEPLFDELKQYNIEIFAIGTNSKKIDNLAKNYNIKCTKSDTMNYAIDKIKALFSLKLENCIALLSPAAASLDQYTSYKHRGKEFKKIVQSTKN
jgi:UDP-N-acetylmuramoylalanine--D-glutamate ligase